jgi:hypothetical protein
MSILFASNMVKSVLLQRKRDRRKYGNLKLWHKTKPHNMYTARLEAIPGDHAITGRGSHARSKPAPMAR